MQDDEAAVILDRLFNRVNDLLAGRFLGGRRLLRDGAARHGDGVPVEKAAVEQTLHHQRDAARCVHIRRHVPAARFQIADEGRG